MGASLRHGNPGGSGSAALAGIWVLAKAGEEKPKKQNG